MHALPISLRRSVLVLGAVLVLTQATGCTRTVHHPGPGPSAPAVYVEIEPNNDPYSPDFIGILDDWSHIVVQGHVEAIGIDTLDHLEFETSMPLELDFSLLALRPGGDADLTIYDPISNTVLGTYAIGGDVESGTIIVHEPYRPFQLIIEAYGLDTDWDLELIAYPYGSSYRTAGDGSGATLEAASEATSGSEVIRSETPESTSGTQPWIEVLGARSEEIDTDA